jgi:AcrR family transcriptional regulator
VTPDHGDRLPARERWRQELRANRRREFLDAARGIVNSEGQGALTMLRLAQEVGTSEGNVYNYFASKDLLLAELEIDALEAIGRSFNDGQDTLRSRLAAAEAAPQLVVLGRAVGSVRFWIAAEATLPHEVELSRRILSQSHALEADHGTRVIAAGLAILNRGAQLLDDATEQGVLDAGVGLRRSLLALSSIVGVLLTSRMDQWDAGLFNGRVLALELIDHLFTGWGAPSTLLAEAGAFVDALSDDDLAPPPGAP